MDVEELSFARGEDMLDASSNSQLGQRRALQGATAVSTALLTACKDGPQRSRKEASREEGEEALTKSPDGVSQVIDKDVSMCLSLAKQ